jgi:hypothetical protein
MNPANDGVRTAEHVGASFSVEASHTPSWSASFRRILVLGPELVEGLRSLHHRLFGVVRLGAHDAAMSNGTLEYPHLALSAGSRIFYLSSAFSSLARSCSFRSAVISSPLHNRW